MGLCDRLAKLFTRLYGSPLDRAVQRVLAAGDRWTVLGARREQEMEALIMTVQDLVDRVTKLQAAAAPETDAVKAINKALDDVFQLYKDAIASSSVPAEQIAAIEAVTAQLEKNKVDITDSIVRDTPAAP